MTSSPETEADGLAPPQLYWATLAIALGLAMSLIDSSIANIALPVIARDLQVTDAASVWVVNSYQLAVTMSLLPLAHLGEVIGYRRVHIGGLVLFTLASLLCALSNGLALLTFARVFQGLGASGMMAVNVALVRIVFPRRKLGAGVGMNAMVGSVATAIGPTTASAVLSVAHWPWLFAINVPIGLIAFAVSWRALPRIKPAPKRFDARGALLCAAVFGLLISGVDGLAHDQRGAIVAAELLGVAVLGAILVRYQRHREAPLLPLDLLRIPSFALSTGSSMCCFAAQALAYVSMPFLLQKNLHLDQVTTGLLLTPWPLAVALVSPLAGRLADIASPALLGGAGLIVMVIGLLLLASLPEHPATLVILWQTALCGVGFGLFNAPNNRAIIFSAPPHRGGSASGMVATSRLFGQTFGAALVALCFELASSSGTRAALILAAGFAAVAATATFARALVTRSY